MKKDNMQDKSIITVCKIVITYNESNTFSACIPSDKDIISIHGSGKTLEICINNFVKAFKEHINETKEKYNSISLEDTLEILSINLVWNNYTKLFYSIFETEIKWSKGRYCIDNFSAPTIEEVLDNLRVSILENGIFFCKYIQVDSFDDIITKYITLPIYYSCGQFITYIEYEGVLYKGHGDSYDEAVTDLEYNWLLREK